VKNTVYACSKLNKSCPKWADERQHSALTAPSSTGSPAHHTAGASYTSPDDMHRTPGRLSSIWSKWTEALVESIGAGETRATMAAIWPDSDRWLQGHVPTARP